MAKAENGHTVQVHYTGKLDNGTVFDTSVGGEPLEFTLGAGQVIPGFEVSVVGMDISEKKTVKIEAAEAYGERRDELMLKVPATNFPEGLNPQVGQQFQVSDNDGHSFVAKVAEIVEGSVTLDANHPLAGEALTFDIELVAVL